jgi:hypothetical protein
MSGLTLDPEIDRQGARSRQDHGPTSYSKTPARRKATTSSFSAWALMQRLLDTIRTFSQNGCMTRQLATVKKTYNLPPELVARVKRIFGTKTETEAIVRCMREVAFMDQIESAVRATAGRFPEYQPLRGSAHR